MGVGHDNSEIVRQNFLEIMRAVKIETPVIEMRKTAAPWLLQWYTENDIWLYEGSDGEHYACVGGQWYFLPTKRVQ
jgi:hypothetical protein